MDTLGTIESVKSLGREDLKGYYSKMVVPENMVLTVVGDVETKQVVLATRKAFGDLKRRDFSPPPVPLESPLPQMRRFESYQKKEQAHFVLGFLGTTLRDKDHYAWRS
jgi:zinc protease